MLRKPSLLLLGLIPLLLSCSDTGSGSLGPMEAETGFEILARTPAPGRAGIDVDTWISVAFTTQVDPTTITSGSIVVNGGLTGTIEVNGKSVRFIPAVPLDSGTSYAIAVSAAIKGSNGLSLGPTPSWGFKTAGTPPPPIDTTIQLGLRPGDAGFGPR